MSKVNDGFTLIELIIATFIITLLFTIGYANYRDYSRRQELLGNARLIESDLRTAQNMANSGVKPTGVSCNALDGYRFKVTGVTYSIIPVCDTVEKTAVKTVNLGPRGISEVAVVNGPSIMFKTLGTGTDFDRTKQFVMTLTQKGTNKKASVTVLPSGEVSYEEN